MKEDSMGLPENPFPIESQNGRLWNVLRHQPYITTKGLHKLGMDTARIRDIRKALKPHLINIACEAIPGVKGDRVYRVKG
jgi:hypothetical protein